MTDNWIENADKTVYKHKANPRVVVIIRKNPSNYPKYLIYHSHPAPRGHAIMQEPEGAMTMESARKRAEKHVLHWNDNTVWYKDEDFGKVGAKGK